MKVSTEGVKKTVTKAQKPKYSVLYLIFMIVAIVLYILMETDWLDELPSIVRIAIYVAFLLMSSFLGTGLTRVLTSTIEEIQGILKDQRKTIGEKLNAIISVIVRCSMIAGEYFEMINDEQFSKQGDE
jgi:hypothetical protein